MKMSNWMHGRALSLMAAGLMVAPIVAGCGSGRETSGGTDRVGVNMPPVDDTYRGSRAQTYAGGGYPQQRQNRGMSTGTKVAILAGAAALYYMYRKNKERRAQGDVTQPQYYLSRNGRVYYRDQAGRAHWVTPPQGGIQVPMEEAMQYRDFQGYNNQTSGRTLMDMMGQGGTMNDGMNGGNMRSPSGAGMGGW